MASLDLKNKLVWKSALGVAVSAGVAGLFFCSHYLPFGFPNQRDQLNALESDFQKKSTELTRARAAVADLPRFEAEYSLLHDRWAAASELLPADRQLAVLLRKISLAGQQTGVSFLMFKPSPPQTQSYYTELPVEISVYGGYHQVGSFLAELANMNRIVTVSKLKLVTNLKGDPLATTSASLTASTYSLNTAAEAAPIVPASPKKENADARKQS